MGFGRGDNLMVISVVVMLVLVNWFSSTAEAFGTFGFDIHHRYSDPVKGILDLDGLPEKGTVDYFSVMAQRDRLFHGRRLAGAVDSTLSFRGGNETYRISPLGFLHYANVSVGTPSLSFLVALDTGSDLFWLPCDCLSCVKAITTRTGRLDFNIYSTNTSTTSMRIPCNSTSCRLRSQCPSTLGGCPYQVNYLSNNTSSTGILVEDVLHLATDHTPQIDVEARIKFGCGMIQTGSFLNGGAPNGLFGLGMDNISVPSMLASEGHAANSFSMCFGHDGTGRINFGDKGSLDQGETPFNVESPHPRYNISITRISVDQNVTDIAFTALFDSGTSFTYLNDPAYTIIGESFTSMIKERRLQPNSRIPFEFCYEISSSQTTIEYPSINLTMKGGNEFSVTSPNVVFQTDGGGYMFCLGLIRSHDINIIGQNFMTGYRVVFDRERMILGWKPSDCYDAVESNKLPLDPRFTPAPTPSPTASVVPQATSSNGGSPMTTPSSPSPQGNSSPRLITFSYTLLALILLVNSFIIL